MNKKRNFGLLGLLVLTIASVGFTIALLKGHTMTLTNTFTIGEVTTHIEEKTDIQKATIHKAPVVVNDGPNDCIIRLRVSISPKEIADYLAQGNIDYGSDWKYNTADGFWYYQHVVSVQKQTTPLFTKVEGLLKEDGTMIDSFSQIKNFEINLYQEAVQAVIWDDSGASISANDENGVYQEKQAQKIWEFYTRK